MNVSNKPYQNYSLDEMINCLRNPVGKHSLAELDMVIDDIIDRNPEFVEEVNKIINQSKK